MDDLDQFKSTYITECFELLEDMEERLLNLEEGATDKDALNAIFRCAHSIKGGAGAFGFNRLVGFTHVAEFLLDALRESKIAVTQDVIDALLKSVDIISQLVTAARDGKDLGNDFGMDLENALNNMCSGGASPAPKAAVKAVEQKSSAKKEFCFYDIKFVPKRRLFASGNEPLLIIRELKKLGDVKAKPDFNKIPEISGFDPEECYMSWSIEVTTDQGLAKIKEAFEFVEDECDLKIEEFGAITMPAAPAKKDLADEDEFGGIFVGAIESLNNPAPVAAVQAPVVAAPAEAKPAEAKKDDGAKTQVVDSIRVDIDKVDNLVNMVGELVITQAMLSQQTKDLSPEQFPDLIQGVEELSRHMRELQEAVMSVRMQPVKSVFARMPRIVRDLSRQLGKEIKLEMKGEATEIDKTVIEQLGDPLTHMIRNSVDHGVEMPDVREGRGKPREGTIILSADSSGGRINIEIADDGNGIDRERVLKKAIEKGLYPQDVKLSNEEIDNIIFMAGFSTAEKVTNVSGRGVGMDVVRRNIAELGGVIDIKNNPGIGMSIGISLPLTLAILDGMIVGVGAEKYIIPINNIIESLRPKSGEVKQVADGNDVINVRGEFVPIIHLNHVFNVPNSNTDISKYLVVLVEVGRQKIGLVVDEVLGQQQVVIKSIEQNADPIDGVSGATILGDGKVALILDIAKIHKMKISNGVNNKVAA